MTQELAGDQKRKTEEEENYRLEIRSHQKQKNQPRSSFPWPIVFVAVIMALLIIVDSPIFLGKKKDATTNQSAIPIDVNEESRNLLELEKEKVAKAKEEEKQQKITELGDIYCRERSKPYARYVNLDDFILMYEKANETINLRPVMNKPPIKTKCDKVMELCLDSWSEKDCEQIAEGNIWIGMSEDQLILAWGLPNDRNNTVNSWGTRSQWVYGSFGPYVYLEGKNKNDLRVTSWQD